MLDHRYMAVATHNAMATAGDLKAKLELTTGVPAKMLRKRDAHRAFKVQHRIDYQNPSHDVFRIVSRICE